MSLKKELLQQMLFNNGEKQTRKLSNYHDVPTADFVLETSTSFFVLNSTLTSFLSQSLAVCHALVSEKLSYLHIRKTTSIIHLFEAIL